MRITFEFEDSEVELAASMLAGLDVEKAQLSANGEAPVQEFDGQQVARRSDDSADAIDEVDMAELSTPSPLDELEEDGGPEVLAVEGLEQADEEPEVEEPEVEEVEVSERPKKSKSDLPYMLPSCRNQKRHFAVAKALQAVKGAVSALELADGLGLSPMDTSNSLQYLKSHGLAELPAGKHGSKWRATTKLRGRGVFRG